MVVVMEDMQKGDVTVEDGWDGGRCPTMLIPKCSGWKKAAVIIVEVSESSKVTTIWQHTDVTDGSEIPKIIKKFYRH